MVGWLVVQPIPLSLPTRVEVELGCDNKSNVSRMVLKRSSMGCFTFSQGSFKLHGSLESKVCIGWLGWAVVIINLQLTL